MRPLLAGLFVVLVAAPAHASSYTAERFDSRIEVLAGGSLRVTETILFRFESGTFSKVFRTIPSHNTDGIEFVSASMDGAGMPEGNGPGHITRRRQNGMRIEWNFAPVGPSTHTFVLSYNVAGVAQKTDAADAIGWFALPKEHPYRIEASTIEISLPSTPSGEPVVDVHRVEQYDLDQGGAHVAVQASGIGKNGWVEVRLRFAAGAIVAKPSAWQQRRQEQRKYLTPSLVAAGLVLFAGLVLLFGLRQSYDPPPRDLQAPRAFSGPPDSLSPALAGTLAANGRPHVEHAMSALFSLAARGGVTIREEAHGRLRGSHFTLSRTGNRTVAPHEQALLDTIFSGSAEEPVELNKARLQVMRGFKRFRDAVVSELHDAGLLDAARRKVQTRYFILAAGIAAVAVLILMPAIALVDRSGPAPMLISLAVGIVALASFVYGFAHTPLSNEGVRRAASWRAFQKHLRNMPQDVSPADLLPFAVAFGLAGSWAKLFKGRGVALPPWFEAASHGDPNKGFATFVAYGGAGATSGHGGVAGAGASAGGGASGAS